MRWSRAALVRAGEASLSRLGVVFPLEHRVEIRLVEINLHSLGRAPPFHFFVWLQREHRVLANLSQRCLLPGLKYIFAASLGVRCLGPSVGLRRAVRSRSWRLDSLIGLLDLLKRGAHCVLEVCAHAAERIHSARVHHQHGGGDTHRRLDVLVRVDLLPAGAVEGRLGFRLIVFARFLGRAVTLLAGCSYFKVGIFFARGDVELLLHSH